MNRENHHLDHATAYDQYTIEPDEPLYRTGHIIQGLKTLSRNLPLSVILHHSLIWHFST